MATKRMFTPGKRDEDAERLIEFLNSGSDILRIGQILTDAKTVALSPTRVMRHKPMPTHNKAIDKRLDAYANAGIFEPSEALSRLTETLEDVFFQAVPHPVKTGKNASLAIMIVPKDATPYGILSRGATAQSWEKESWMILAVIRLSITGALQRVRLCNCGKWFWSVRNEQQHCSAKCRMKKYLSGEKVAAERRKYQRDYQRKNRIPTGKKQRGGKA